MKYLKYFESNNEIDRCTVHIFKKTNTDGFNHRWNLERTDDKVFKSTKGMNALDKAIKWCTEMIQKQEIDGMAIYQKVIGKEMSKPENLLRWWQIPNSNGTGTNYFADPKTYASTLSKYLFGLSNAYMIFGRQYKNQYDLCNVIRTKAPKSWDTIKNLLGETDSKGVEDAADLGNMGFTD